MKQSRYEKVILEKLEELINTDLTKIKYTEIPHLLLIVTKIVYEEKQLNDVSKKELIIKTIELLIDKSNMIYTLKVAIKDLVPHMVDKYICIDNGDIKIKIHTYGKTGKMWIKIRSFFDKKILGV